MELRGQLAAQQVAPKARLVRFVANEFREIVAPTLFFAVSFNIIVLTTQLILDDYFVRFANFLVATGAALLVGKAVLVANALPFLRRFDRAPLIQPILFKTVIYFLVVFIVRLLEKLVEYFLDGGTLTTIPGYLAEHFSWHRFTAVQIWVFVLFLVYVTASEINALLGDGELAKILFTRRSTDLKLNRRQQIRSLTRLSRLIDAHTIEELQDRNTLAHRELIALIAGMTRRT